MTLINKTISNYELISKIGEGGMGEVYLAQDTKLDRKVALKILPADVAANQDRMRRFVQEAKAASALNHPNILTVHEVGEADSIRYIATEYVDGETLRQRAKRARVSLHEALDIASQLAAALAAAHKAGVVHRDIKPENIMIRHEDGIVKVLDFGLAKLSEQPSSTSIDTEAPTRALINTAPGIVMGTAIYMSPEQARGVSVDARSDLFSLGVVLYEIIAGHTPFTGTTTADLLASILAKEPLPLTQQAADVPTELERIVQPVFGEGAGAALSIGAGVVDRLEISRRRTLATATCPKGLAIHCRAAVRQYERRRGERILLRWTGGRTAQCALENRGPSRRCAHFSLLLQGKETDVRETGRKLNVATVLEGSVRKADKRLRITVQLSNVADGYHLWSAQYDRKLDDIFAIQEEIAEEISGKLRLKLTGKEKKRLATRPTENLAAYRHYLKGRYYWKQFTEEGFRKAVEQFHLAIAEEPSYGQAYAGLADSYMELSFFGYMAPHETYPKAKAAAQKALGIDSSLAEAHWSMANANFYYEWDWAAAGRGYQRAIQLSPRDPTARQNYGFFLAAMGRYDEALEQLKIAQEVDPLSPVFAATSAMILFHARRADEGVELCRKILELDPGYTIARWVLAWCLQTAGLYEPAVVEAERAFDASGGSPQFLAVLGHAYGLSGQQNEARKVLEQLLEQRTRSRISLFLLALVYTGLGQKDEVFQCLEEAFEERTGWMVWLRSFPALDSLSDDLRYRDLLRRVGL